MTMEAASTSETSVSFCQTARHNIAEKQSFLSVLSEIVRRVKIFTLHKSR
jgi:hypothetical protein